MGLNHVTGTIELHTLQAGAPMIRLKGTRTYQLTTKAQLKTRGMRVGDAVTIHIKDGIVDDIEYFINPQRENDEKIPEFTHQGPMVGPDGMPKTDEEGKPMFFGAGIETVTPATPDMEQHGPTYKPAAPPHVLEGTPFEAAVPKEPLEAPKIDELEFRVVYIEEFSVRARDINQALEKASDVLRTPHPIRPDRLFIRSC